MPDTLLDYDSKAMVNDILHRNKDKNFVRRILDPQAYPTLDNKDGSHSSHSMAWSDSPDGKYIVYPTVVYDEQTKKLRRLGDKQAYEHAVSTGEMIEFDTPDEADWFSKKYKSVWK